MMRPRKYDPDWNEYEFDDEEDEGPSTPVPPPPPPVAPVPAQEATLSQQCMIGHHDFDNQTTLLACIHDFHTEYVRKRARKSPRYPEFKCPTCRLEVKLQDRGPR